ncbi:nucleoside hydrolase (plasmid) [Croceibacterium sp. TMG7-5b_MA50]|uniref:nucleoside hydrolase n=1 Tax=Croceibacterium sp. TMG7-5b_MA50 TaxID=3121290 RepID=UPI0032214971
MIAATRRRALTLAGGGAGLLLARGALAQAAAGIRLRPAARVIVDNDFAGNPDGLIALAHQVLSPTTIVPLVTCSPLDPQLAGPLAGRSAAEAARLVGEMLPLADLPSDPQVVAGAEGFGGGEGPSLAARAIVAEALRDDPLPLIVTCGGPLTNVAAALRLEPAIAARMTLIWIGGGGAGEPEYNQRVDEGAARFVLEETAVPLWQVPQPAYRQLQFGMAEMEAAFRPLSPLTRWLYDRYTTLPDWVQLGGALAMGDTPMVLLSAIGGDSSTWREVPAGPAGRTIRLYDRLDARLALADMLARFRLHAERSR